MGLPRHKEDGRSLGPHLPGPNSSFPPQDNVSISMLFFTLLRQLLCSMSIERPNLFSHWRLSLKSSSSPLDLIQRCCLFNGAAVPHDINEFKCPICRAQWIRDRSLTDRSPEQSDEYERHI